MTSRKDVNTNRQTEIERERTDQSLQRERHRTDDALALKQKQTEDLADNILERAREHADEILGVARKRADARQNPDGEGWSKSNLIGREAVEQERVDEDFILKQERASADDSLRWERVQQSSLLAALLPLERERTDLSLLTERELADDAIVNRDDLMGMVGHDLQNLLAGIAIHARILANQASDSDEGKRTLFGVDRIERYVACMNRLIGDLVDVTSVEAGKFVVHPRPGDVVELISEAIASFDQSAQEKGLSLEFTTDLERQPGVFDKQRMTQVVANLIANAMKFTPSGGAITLEVACVGDDVRVSVLDSGEGIAPEMLEAVFERFGQAAGTTPSGLGLGLYISKCIVEAQGGRIWAEGNPIGIGSAFHLTIPALGSASTLPADRMMEC